MTKWIALRRNPNEPALTLATEAYGPFDSEQAARDFALYSWDDDNAMRAWSVCPLLPLPPSGNGDSNG